MSLEITRENAGVVRHFSGTVTDLRRSIEEIHADLRFSELRYSINDHILVAIVATSPAVLELAAFYASPSYLSYPIKVFAPVEEAREWIARGVA